MVSVHLPRRVPKRMAWQRQSEKTLLGVLSMDGHVFLSLDAVGSPGEGLSHPPAQGDQPSPASDVQSLGNQGNLRFGGGTRPGL